MRTGLPGIATNLLADRLRELEQAGIVYREQAPPPIATALFGLTPRGEELRPAVEELTRWGLPLMREQRPDDAVRSHWLLAAIDLMRGSAAASVSAGGSASGAFVLIAAGTIASIRAARER